MSIQTDSAAREKIEAVEVYLRAEGFSDVETDPPGIILDLLAVGLQRHANHLVERVRELGAGQRSHGRKIGKRNALPDVPVEERADPPYGASVPGHGERIAQQGQLPLLYTRLR